MLVSRTEQHMMRFKTTLPAAFALALAIAAAPAAAQGKSGQHGHGQEKPKHETVRSGGGWVDGHGTTHTETRASTSRARHTTSSRPRSTPPGWCQGRGNPHNTAANCGYRTDRVYRDRNGVWRDRYGHRLANGNVYRDRSGTLRDYLGRLLH
jgi:hypothetical protein